MTRCGASAAMSIPSQSMSLDPVKDMGISAQTWSHSLLASEQQNQAQDLHMPKSNPLGTLNLDTVAKTPQTYIDMQKVSPAAIPALNQPTQVPSVQQNQLSLGLGLSPSASSINGDTNSTRTHLGSSALPASPMENSSAYSHVDLHHATQGSVPTPPGNTLTVPIMSSRTSTSEPGEHSTFSSSEHLHESVNLLPDIGASVDELAAAAADARVHFHGGQFDKCSTKMDTVKQLIKRIASMGLTGLSMSTEVQQQRQNPSTTHVPFAALVTPEQEKNMNSAATFSMLSDDIECRKRRLLTEMQSPFPLKSHRGDQAGVAMQARSCSDLPDNSGMAQSNTSASQATLFSPSVQSGMFEFSVPPPSSFAHRPSLSASSTFGLQEPANVTQQKVSSIGSVTNTSTVLGNHIIPSGSPQQSISNSHRPSLTSNQLNFTQATSGNNHTMLDLGATDALSLALKSSTATPNETWTPEGVDPLTATVPVTHQSSTKDTPVDASVSSLKDASFDDWNDGPGDRSATGITELSPELRAVYEDAFHDFLNSLCSNLDAKDERGELIHQTLMPKKMARLDESPDFRPFKFRIQAFTMAFKAELHRRGLDDDDDASMRRIKPFLWSHPFISRFNEDGKKAKSKGNHIWIVKARRLPKGGWEFFTFSPKIAGAASKVAYINEPWTWNLRIWDPQASHTNIKVVYSANTMPSWLHWEDDEKVLTGVPQHTSQGGNVSVTALYVHLGQLHRLEHSFFLHVLPRPDDARSVGEEMSKSSAATAAVSTPVAPTPRPAAATTSSTASTAVPTLPLAATLGEETSSTAAVNNVFSSQQPVHHQQAAPVSSAAPQTAAAASAVTAAATATAPQSNASLHTSTGLSSTPANESQKYEVVEPSQAHDVLSSISFPFTPPVYMDKAMDPMHAFDPALLHHQHMNAQHQKATPLSDALPQTAVFVDKTAANTAPAAAATSPPAAAAIAAAAVGSPQPPAQAPPTTHVTPPVPSLSPPSIHTPAAMGMSPGVPSEQDPRPMMQMWNVIERRQREQASSFMLCIPQRPQSFTLNEHPGQGTPMTNMPNDMGATLPVLNPNPTSNPQ